MDFLPEGRDSNPQPLVTLGFKSNALPVCVCVHACVSVCECERERIVQCAPVVLPKFKS